MVKKRYTLSNIRLPFEVDPAEARIEATKILGIAPAALEGFRIDKRSVDCRKRKIFFVYTVSFDCESKYRPSAKPVKVESFHKQGKGIRIPLASRPIVIGTGPAGIFAAQTLAEHGFAPMIFERGGDVPARHKYVKKFLQTGEFDSDNNLFVGEGGAGTYSDGKLTGRSAGAYAKRVLRGFTSYGADDSIMTDAYPHIGSDRLRGILPAFRKALEEKGCEFHFNTAVISIQKSVDGYEVETTEGKFTSQVVIFACGQNLKSNYWLLRKAGVDLEMKPFQMGVRLEFPQEIIERRMYGEHAFDPRLPRAKVNLVFHDDNTGLSIHSFCNCPGGTVLPTPETEGLLSVNGMSDFSQDGAFCNTALVSTFYGIDLGVDNPLELIDKRHEIEQKAFEIGGGNFKAGAIKTQDLASGKTPSKLPSSSYPLGLSVCNLKSVMPSYFVNTLRSSLGSFESRVPGVLGASSLLIAAETRASSPIRVPRDSNMHVQGMPNLFVVGEGSGYAGGIMSSAVDGIKAASKIITEYKPK